MDHALRVQIEDEKDVDNSSEISFEINEEQNNHEKAFLGLTNNEREN